MAELLRSVFFITPDFQDSSYLRSEIDDALTQKVARGEGFALILLILTDERGNEGRVPDSLSKYNWKKPTTSLEGVKFILEALPRYLLKSRGSTSLPVLVTPLAREVALVGQNLSSRMGLDPHRYSKFLGELTGLFRRNQLETVVLMMMTPKALKAIHPLAAEHLRLYSLPNLLNLRRDFPGEERIRVVFHPAATLSLVAVDWTQPAKAHAFVTPKFQTTAGIDDRVSMLLDERYFDSASLARMLMDATGAVGGACGAPLREAPRLLERLLNEENL